MEEKTPDETSPLEELLERGLDALFKEGTPEGRSASAPADAPRTTRGDYEILGKIARGGMGEILKGRDRDLGREVAMKVLLEELAHEPAAQQRFVEEAQIGGQLQHPGIVPIYELGLMADQRPYFTMKLVEGRTLSELLGERDSVADGRHRFLAIFEQVCQAVAYAHARGVVHRDLKPSNVMIGKFGEVQVLDWGLAKPLEREDTGVATVRTRSAPAIKSETGTIMGTPEYMSPEQARGDVESLDQRSDVFSLGAVLLVILTGKPPYSGGSASAREAAAKPDLEDANARLDACGEDEELVAICRRCLQPDPDSRPSSAEVLANEIAAHLSSVEERARAAQIAAAETRVKAREEKKLILAGAAVVLLLGFASLAVFGWFERERDARRARLDGTLTASLEDATRLRGQAESSGDPAVWRETLAAIQGAEALLDTGDPSEDVAVRVRAFAAEVRVEEDAASRRAALEQSNRELLAALEEVRVPEGLEIYPTDWTLVDAQFSACFREQGLPMDGTPVENAESIRARGLGHELAAALDGWSAVRRRAEDPEGAEHLAEIARAVDQDDTRMRLRSAIAAGDVDELLRFADRDDLDTLPATTLVLYGNALGDVVSPELAVEVLRAAQAANPDDFAMNVHLARWHLATEPPRPVKAIGFFRAALALRPSSVEMRHELGMTLADQLGDHTEAEELFRQAIRAHPEDGHLYFHIGLSLQELGRADEAIDAYRKSVELSPDAPKAFNNLGVALHDAGEHGEAIEALREAIRLQEDYARAHYNLGRVLGASGESQASIDAYRESLQHDPEFASAHYNLALALDRSGDLDGAIDELRAALEDRADHHEARRTLGVLLRDVGDVDGSIELLRDAGRRVPDDPLTHFSLAQALDDNGDLEGACDAYGEAARLRTDWVPAHYNLGTALLRSSRLEEAVDAFRATIELDPEHAEAHCNLGIALDNLCRYEEALDEYRIGHELGQQRANWRYPSAQWVSAAEYRAGLDAEVREYIEQGTLPTDAEALLALAQFAGRTRRPGPAVDLFTAATAHGPTPPAETWIEARSWFSLDLEHQGEILRDGDEAERAAARRRLESWWQDPRLAGVRDPEATRGIAEEERSAWEALWIEVERLLAEHE